MGQKEIDAMFKNSASGKRLACAIGVASLAAIALTGCGGGGGIDNSSPVVTNSPFAGNYVGTFTTSNSQSGTVNVTVATNGGFTGSGYNSTIGQSETNSGSITNAGILTASFAYPSTAATVSGAVAFASNGHLDGTLTQPGGGNGSVTIDLVKQ